MQVVLPPVVGRVNGTLEIADGALLDLAPDPGELLDANTLQYEVTVTDPYTWVRPWTVRFAVPRDDRYEMFEYACHEGNYAMANSLRGARARERQAR